MDMRRYMRFAAFAAIMAASLAALSSCLKNEADHDDSTLFANAIVTVKPLAEGGFYMQLDEETTLFPANAVKSPYDEEQRAFVNFSPSDADAGEYDMAVYVNWFRDILTKDMVQAASGTDLDEEYGTDPVNIMDSWMTAVEDGYFTIHFETYSDGTGIKHKVNLVQPDPEKPFELEFRHDASGDVNGDVVWSVAAFRLSDLNLENGKKVTITLKWDSFTGKRSHDFEYVPGTVADDGGQTGDETPGTESVLNLE